MIKKKINKGDKKKEGKKTNAIIAIRTQLLSCNCQLIYWSRAHDTNYAFSINNEKIDT